jgi:hypothetical protein
VAHVKLDGAVERRTSPPRSALERRARRQARLLAEQGNGWGAAWQNGCADYFRKKRRTLTAPTAGHQPGRRPAAISSAPRAREHRARSTRSTRATASAPGSSDPEPPPASLTLACTLPRQTAASPREVER